MAIKEHFLHPVTEVNNSHLVCSNRELETYYWIFWGCRPGPIVYVSKATGPVQHIATYKGIVIFIVFRLVDQIIMAHEVAVGLNIVQN